MKTDSATHRGSPPPPGDAELPAPGAQLGSPQTWKRTRGPRCPFLFGERHGVGGWRGHPPQFSRGAGAAGTPGSGEQPQNRYRTGRGEHRSFSPSKAETYFLVHCGCVPLAGSLPAAGLPRAKGNQQPHGASTDSSTRLSPHWRVYPVPGLAECRASGGKEVRCLSSGSFQPKRDCT